MTKTQKEKSIFCKILFPRRNKRLFFFFLKKKIVGRQRYHSKYELFKSDVHDLTTLEKLEKKITILKNMEEFISKDFEEIQD